MLVEHRADLNRTARPSGRSYSSLGVQSDFARGVYGVCEVFHMLHASRDLIIGCLRGLGPYLSGPWKHRVRVRSAGPSN